jgi:hypothetical protein
MGYTESMLRGAAEIAISLRGEGDSPAVAVSFP